MFSFMQSRVDRSMHMHRLLSLFSKKKKKKKKKILGTKDYTYLQVDIDPIWRVIFKNNQKAWKAEDPKVILKEKTTTFINIYILSLKHQAYVGKVCFYMPFWVLSGLSLCFTFVLNFILLGYKYSLSHESDLQAWSSVSLQLLFGTYY